MAYQNISAELSDSDLADVKKLLQQLKDKLPFLVNLTATERKNLYKMGPKSIDFVNDCQVVAQNYPQILPSTFDTTEFTKDAQLAKSLSEINLLVDVLAMQINDTAMAVGSEAMNTSLQVYDYAKTAAKREAGIKIVAEQLKARFKEQGKKANKEQQA